MNSQDRVDDSDDADDEIRDKKESVDSESGFLKLEGQIYRD